MASVAAFTRAEHAADARPLGLPRTTWLALAATLTITTTAWAADDERCPAGALTERASVAGPSRGERITDGRHADEGAPWNAPAALPLADAAVIELARPRLVAFVRLQADNDDSYVVERSLDGITWSSLWTAPPVRGAGLRTRHVRLAAPVELRYLRVRGTAGDGIYAVSELAAYCRAPSEPMPSSSRAAQRAEARWLTDDRLDTIKATVAVLGLLLFAWGLVLRRAQREDVDRRKRDGVLVGLGMLSAVCWWNLFTFHAGKYQHTWELYHYYVGAKYFDELGYTRLYPCAIVADAEDGFLGNPQTRRFRNLETNAIERAESILHRSDACKRHFTPARWAEYKRDLAWFRSQMDPSRWAAGQLDHGYNATPVWGIAGTVLANVAPASDAWLMVLSLLDPLLIAVMWGVAYWAFGWRAVCVALLWWGTNYPARYFWVGGGFLRQDWLALTVIGVSLARKNRMVGAGVALTYAALLRIFPGFIVAGLLLKAGMRMWRERRLVVSKEHAHFALGCAAALVVLFALGSVVGGGIGTWSDFARNSEKHLSTPLTNNMGLKTVIAYDHDRRAQVTIEHDSDDPFGRWKNARRDVFSSRALVFALAVLVFLVLLARAVEHEPDWSALALGVGLIPIATELTCYYYSFLLLYGLSYERGGVRLAMALCALAAVTHVVPRMWTWYDEAFTWISLATVVFVAAVTASWRRLVRTPALPSGARSVGSVK